jgi:HD-like signal output (HDOD) protein
MTFALGRRLGYADMPAVRGIVRQAEAGDQRLSAFVLAIVKSPAFRMKSADVSTSIAEAVRR